MLVSAARRPTGALLQKAVYGNNQEASLARKLDIIDAAADENDLRIPLGNRFEHLQGKLSGWCSIRVNKQHRLIFEWDGEKADNLYLDPDTYR